MASSFDFNNTTDFKKVKIIVLKGEKGDQGDAGVSGDYAGLSNKPSINGVQLNGNKTSNDLGIASQASVDALEQNLGDLSDSVYTKSEVVPKSEMYGNNLDYRINIPVVFTGNIVINMNYTFTADGYLAYSNGAEHSGEFNVTLYGANHEGYAINSYKLDKTFSQMIYVKKGMQVHFSGVCPLQSYADDIDIWFTPFLLME